MSAPCLPRFILLVSFSNILFAVLILSMSAICGCLCSPGRVINSFCGNYWGGFWAVSTVESLAHERTSPSEFILLVSFNDALLVVSILSVIVICHCFCSPRGEPCGLCPKWRAWCASVLSLPSLSCL